MPLVDLVATVGRFADAAEVVSPVSGERGVAIHLEVFENDTSLGEMVLGDAIELACEDAARYVVVVRRARFAFLGVRRELAVEKAPAELVPLLVRSRGGALVVREHVVREGDRLRLRAQVEGGVVRDDLAPLRLDEAL